VQGVLEMVVGRLADWALIHIVVEKSGVAGKY